MRYLVAEGAKLACSMGTDNPLLKLIPRKHMVDKREIANVEDNVPLRDIPSFGMCKSMANPSVATATATAAGVLTPMACTPPLFSPWAPGAKFVLQVLSDGRKVEAITNESRCVCAYAGIVTILNPNSRAKVSDSASDDADQEKKKQLVQEADDEKKKRVIQEAADDG